MKPDFKYLRLLIFLCFLIGQMSILRPACSQVETRKDTTGQIPDSILRYISSTDYAFMMHEETSWMLKGSLILVNNYTNGLPIKVAFEKRIANSFTINLAVDHSKYNIPGDNSFYIPINVTLESRWYYRLNKRIRQNNVARSMSDNYFALGVGYVYLLNNYNENPNLVSVSYLSLYSKWGIQRRFLKHGHADLGINIGVMNPINDGFKPSLVFNTYVELGLCWTNDSYKLDHEKLCPFIKCYEADNFIIKSSLSNLISIGFFKYYRWIDLSPQLAFERKIGTSAFSINTEINGTFGYSEYFVDTSAYSTYIVAGLLLEGRWYYDLNKRILMGNTGNGLSADYFSFGGSYYYNNDTRDEYLSYNGLQLHIATGWQRLFSKHMYYDLQVGINYYFESDNIHLGDHFEPRTRVALGYRF
jgi:hypothetical protein